MMGYARARVTTVIVEGVVAGLNIIFALVMFIFGTGDTWMGLIPLFGGVLLLGETIERVQSSEKTEEAET